MNWLFPAVLSCLSQSMLYSFTFVKLCWIHTSKHFTATQKEGFPHFFSRSLKPQVRSCSSLEVRRKMSFNHFTKERTLKEMSRHQKDTIYEAASKNHNSQNTFPSLIQKKGNMILTLLTRSFPVVVGTYIVRSDVDSGTLFHPNDSYYFGFAVTYFHLEATRFPFFNIMNSATCFLIRVFFRGKRITCLILFH